MANPYEIPPSTHHPATSARFSSASFTGTSLFGSICAFRIPYRKLSIRFPASLASIDEYHIPIQDIRVPRLVDIHLLPFRTASAVVHEAQTATVEEGL